MTALLMIGYSRRIYSLWDALMMAQWNSWSARGQSPPSAAMRSIRWAFFSICASSSSVARRQARATVAGSKISRISNRSFARTRDRSPARLVRSNPAAGRSSLTKVPLPRRISRTPWATRKEMASRRVVRLTFSASLSSFSLGSLLPGA